MVRFFIMAKFKLIAVNRTNMFLNINSDSESYTLTYEKKAWYYFGKIKIVKKIVNCPDYQMSSWLESIKDKIEKGEWRKG